MTHFIVCIYLAILCITVILFGVYQVYTRLHPNCPHCGKRFKQRIKQLNVTTFYDLETCPHCNLESNIFQIWWYNTHHTPPWDRE
jgi:peptide subunit release factor 1 (eRF1)